MKKSKKVMAEIERKHNHYSTVLLKISSQSKGTHYCEPKKSTPLGTAPRKRRMYDEDYCIAMLRVKGVQFESEGRNLIITKPDELGNNSWGKISYLRAYCGWSVKNDYHQQDGVEKKPIIIRPEDWRLRNAKRLIN